MDTLLKILGIGAVLFIGAHLYIVGFLLFMNNMGTYNIGGVPNGWKIRTFVVAYWSALVYATYWFFTSVFKFSIVI